MTTTAWRRQSIIFSNKKEEGTMPFITLPEAAILWHISVSELRELCENHMISGAVRVHQRWFIPETAACPSAQHPLS